MAKTDKKIKAKVSEKKKKMLKELVAAILNNNTIMVTSIRGIPCSQFQTIKKKLNDLNKTQAKVIKKHIIKLAMEEAAKTKPKIKELEKFFEEGEAVLFSNIDAFELSGMLADNKVAVKAKPGQEAPEDLIVEAGPTDIPAGPMISELAEARIKVKVEGGKLVIQQDVVVTKKGEKIKANVAGILSKLDIMPFKVGLTPLAAYDSKEDKVFENIKVDKEVMLKNISIATIQALNLAINSFYPCKETIIFLIGKASREANAINLLAQPKEIMPETKETMPEPKEIMPETKETMPEPKEIMPETSPMQKSPVQEITQNTQINSQGG